MLSWCPVSFYIIVKSGDRPFVTAAPGYIDGAPLMDQYWTKEPAASFMQLATINIALTSDTGRTKLNKQMSRINNCLAY